MPFTADGKLFYRVTGEGRNRAIVFIHGAGGSGQLFGNQFQAFRDHAQCYFLDLPGYGASPQPEGQDSILNLYTKSVIDFVISLSRPTILLGHSMGGAVAIEIALSRAELLQGLILVGTGCRLPVSEKVLTGLDTDCDNTLEKIVRYCFSKSVAPDLLESARAQMRKTPPEIVRADFRACSVFNLCDQIRDIKLPTLVICGEKDIMIPPDLSRQLAASIPHARLEIIPQGSHMVMLERPERFNEILRSFCSST